MGPKRTNKRPSFIPDDILDTEVQKQVLMGLFVLVQAWKVYDLILLNTNHVEISNFSFVVKYITLDSLLILIVPVLNIPQIPLSFGLSLIIMTIVNLFTFTLTSTTPILATILPMVLPHEKELEIMENLVDTSLDQSIHFKGKKKLRMAPDSSIKLNPFNAKFCVQPVYNSNVNIPFELDSMNGLDYLQINHIDVNNNSNVLNFTDFRTGSTLKLDKPGFYSIKSALDKKGKSIKPIKSNAFIPVCPEAAFKKMDLNPKCENDMSNQLHVDMFGVPPFTLLIQEEINGKLSTILPINSIAPEGFQSPLQEKRELIKSDITDLSWMMSNSVSIPINKKHLKAGDYVYSISKVIDGFGNEIIYQPDLSNTDTLITFKVLKNPSFDLTDPQPNTPILLGRKKSLDIKIKNCEFSNTFSVEFLYKPFDDDKVNKVEKFQREFTSLTGNKLEIEKPGIYSISNGHCSICNGVNFGSPVSIKAAKLPNFDISLDEIIDNCVGTTGFKFNFDFTSGSQPFEIGYKISKLDPNDPSKVIKVENISKLISNSNSYEYEFNPKSEGSYSIEFLNLSDRYYKNQIKFNDGEHRYVTYFKQRPKVSFNKRQINLCNGQSAEIDVNLDGKFPFNLSYDIISPNGEIQTFNEFGIESSPFRISTQNFINGGEYNIKLNEVTDSSSCDVEFNIKEIKLVVKSDVPKIAFNSNQSHFNIVQGTSINVLLDNQGPMDLVYAHKSDSGEINQYKITKSGNGLKLDKSGVYNLVSFSQHGCPGEVNERSISVDYLPKPYLTVVEDENKTKISENEFQNSAICQNDETNISLSLFGSLPFIIEYTISKPDGGVETRIDEIDSHSYDLPIQSSNLSGVFKYTITSIYDSLYTENILKSLRQKNEYKFNPIVINQLINKLPSGRFTTENDEEESIEYESCVMLPDGVKPIEIELQGQPPLSLKLDIFHSSTNSHDTQTFQDLNNGNINFNSIYQSLDVGNHIVTISEVVDANGCSSLNEDEDSITIKVNDLPNMTHLKDESNQIGDENYYCVGDHISYSLIGTPPFLITYEFNDDLQKSVEIPTNLFKRRTPGPGSLNILSLKDSIGCEINFDKNDRGDLIGEVHDLPSVEIIQGESIEVDVYEGEQVDIKFILTGSPPFKLTYVRLDLDDESKIVETESVENITDNEYKISASLEGTYEAVVIQDRYCIAKNPKFF